jgi:hypothetical protein
MELTPVLSALGLFLDIIGVFLLSMSVFYGEEQISRLYRLLFEINKDELEGYHTL